MPNTRNPKRLLLHTTVVFLALLGTANCGLAQAQRQLSDVLVEVTRGSQAEAPSREEGGTCA